MIQWDLPALAKDNVPRLAALAQMIAPDCSICRRGRST